VNKQNGHLDDAIESFESIVETRFQEARDRGFDFGKDYRVLNELGLTLFDRSKLERGTQRARNRETLLHDAEARFRRALEIDPENVTAHYGLAQVYARLGDTAREVEHRALHARFKPDDSAGYVVNIHRRNHPAANHAAEPIVVYDLQREGAYTGAVVGSARGMSARAAEGGRK
jgi:tetratricopeptide (TPR) repeat protein